MEKDPLPEGPSGVAALELARAAFAAKRYAEAAALFEAVALESPADALAAHNKRAAAWLELGRFADAAAAASAALSLDGASVKAHYRYARALHGMGKHRSGWSACERALRLAPTNAQLAELQAACARAAEEEEEEGAGAAAGQAATEARVVAEPTDAAGEAGYDAQCEAAADEASAQLV